MSTPLQEDQGHIAFLRSYHRTPHTEASWFILTCNQISLYRMLALVNCLSPVHMRMLLLWVIMTGSPLEELKLQFLMFIFLINMSASYVYRRMVTCLDAQPFQMCWILPYIILYFYLKMVIWYISGLPIVFCFNVHVAMDVLRLRFL